MERGVRDYKLEREGQGLQIGERVVRGYRFERIVET